MFDNWKRVLNVELQSGSLPFDCEAFNWLARVAFATKRTQSNLYDLSGREGGLAPALRRAILIMKNSEAVFNFMNAGS
jgi:hypothetical protein